MVAPITEKLSKSIMESIEIDKIIYAELTWPGGMGNSGGVIIYISSEKKNKMLCYETNIFQDKETFILAEETLFKHLDKEKTKNDKDNLYFNLYEVGMGNNVFINKKAVLTVKDHYFVYTADNIEFQIFSSSFGVFMNVVDQLEIPNEE